MFKYCPTCKSTNIKFINNHFIRCFSCDFIYYHNAAAAVAAIIECQGEILFTVRAKDPGMGLLDLPGGFVDHHESLESALSREISEELSINIEAKQFHYLCSEPNTYQYKQVKYHTTDSIFITKLTHKPSILIEKVEIRRAIWLAFDDIEFDKMAFDSLKNGVVNYLKHA